MLVGAEWVEHVCWLVLNGLSMYIGWCLMGLACILVDSLDGHVYWLVLNGFSMYIGWCSIVWMSR